jgi:hypothetical protein
MWSSVHFSLLAVGQSHRCPLMIVTHGWTIEVIRADADGVLGLTSRGHGCRRTKLTGTLQPHRLRKHDRRRSDLLVVNAHQQSPTMMNDRIHYCDNSGQSLHWCAAFILAGTGRVLRSLPSIASPLGQLLARPEYYACANMTA